MALVAVSAVKPPQLLIDRVPGSPQCHQSSRHVRASVGPHRTMVNLPQIVSAIVDGTVHVPAVMAVEGDRAISGHVHRAQIGTWFARVYVQPSARLARTDQ